MTLKKGIRYMLTLMTALLCWAGLTIEPERTLFAQLLLLAVSSGMVGFAFCKPIGRHNSIVTLLFGGVFGAFMLAGYEVHTYETVERLVDVSKLMETVLRFAGHTIACWCGLRTLVWLVQRIPVGTTLEKPRTSLSFGKIWLILFVCWLPYFICFYPGCVSTDSVNELYIVLGQAPFTNHHPVIHLWTIAPFVWLGQALGSLEWGVALYSLFQMAVMAAIFAAAVRFLIARHAPRWVVLALMAFYALVSTNAFYSITMWKDVLFGGLTVAVIILLTKLTLDGQWKSRRMWLLLTACLFLFCLYRNNGYYAFLLAFPLYLLCNRKLWKPLLAVGMSVLLLVNGYQTLIFDVLGAEKSATGETLSVPLQQMPRTMRYHHRSLTEEEYAMLEEIFPSVEEVRWAYDPHISDPVKSIFRSEVFNEDPMRYIKLWAQIGLRHPLVYLDSFLYHTHGYWYPDAPYWAVYPGIDENTLGLKAHSTAVSEAVLKLYYQLEGTTVIGALFRPAPYVWLVLAACCVLICKRRLRLMSPWLFLLGIWGTTLLSPVFAEYRYMYGVIAAAPLCIGIALTIPKYEK